MFAIAIAIIIIIIIIIIVVVVVVVVIPTIIDISIIILANHFFYSIAFLTKEMLRKLTFPVVVLLP